MARTRSITTICDMEQENKSRLEKGLKVLAVFVYALITIITCAAVWNAGVGAFLSITALVLLVLNGYVIYNEVKKIKEDEA